MSSIDDTPPTGRTGESVTRGEYGHTADDLERLRMVVSETHPHVEFMLEPFGEITYWDGDIDGATVRRALRMAAISDQCQACFEATPEPWVGQTYCREIQRPPYADDCGATTERAARIALLSHTGGRQEGSDGS